MRPPTPPDEADRLQALYELNVLDTPPEPDFDDVVVLASHICGVPMSLVSLVDEDRQWYKARVGIEESETSRDLSFCAHAILGQDLMVVPDTTADARFADHPAVVDEPGIRFYAGAPLVTSDGYALGTLCVVDTTPRRLKLGQVQALRALARQVTAQLELRRYGAILAYSNARFHELERHLAEFSGLAGKLREPLSAIRTALAEGDTASAFHTVADHADPMRHLIDELLLLTGPTHGGALRLREVDLSRLTERAVDAVRPIADAKSVPVLSTTVSPTPVRADPIRLEQALSHLLYKAVKYAPECGRVEVSAGLDGATVRVRDLDMPSGDRPRLFSHFYREALARQQAGEDCADRGLAIVKAIFDAHHATVALSDRPGDGTSLHVVFPDPVMTG
jgi:signal transduction histidine kinase